MIEATSSHRTMIMPNNQCSDEWWQLLTSHKLVYQAGKTWLWCATRRGETKVLPLCAYVEWDSCSSRGGIYHTRTDYCSMWEDGSSAWLRPLRNVLGSFVYRKICLICGNSTWRLTCNNAPLNASIGCEVASFYYHQPNWRVSFQMQHQIPGQRDNLYGSLAARPEWWASAVLRRQGCLLCNGCSIDWSRAGWCLRKIWSHFLSARLDIRFMD
jgi:hypothetical protein